MVLDETNKYFYEWFRHPDIGYDYLFNKYIFPDNIDFYINNYEMIYKYDLVYYFTKYYDELKLKGILNNVYDLIIKYDSVNILKNTIYSKTNNTK
jgi:hypothetical protein